MSSLFLVFLIVSSCVKTGKANKEIKSATAIIRFDIKKYLREKNFECFYFDGGNNNTIIKKNVTIFFLSRANS